MTFLFIYICKKVRLFVRLEKEDDEKALCVFFLFK